jgi:NAD(P)-dependent dehydrogenase (short-subunit alcohol dehydrogenase family)/uncharacterized OB-fold protein
VLLPPAVRSRAALGLTAAAATGRFELQVCRACGAVQYPPRDACHQCLSVLLDWKLQDGRGELISETTVLHSQDAFFRERLPIRVGLVRLASGPTAVVYLHDEVPVAPAPVKVDVRLDKAGQAALVAFPAAGASDGSNGSNAHPTQKRLLREMSCDPECRKVLVTDGSSAIGLALVEALVEAGAQRVWAGYRAGAVGGAALEDLARRFQQVSLLALDVTSDESVRQAATEVATQVDVVVSNAQVSREPAQGPAPLVRSESESEPMPRASGDSDDDDGGDGVAGAGAGAGASAHEAMDVHYFGLLRLAAEFAPAMRARAGAPDSTVTAWVNLLSIYALSSLPQESFLSAAYAAAHSFSQSLRAQMLTAGIRVVNVFPGPVEGEVEGQSQAVPPPKLSPVSLANAIVKSLRAGVEDVYPGDVAQEWFSMWRANPKVLERELSVSAEPQ